MKECIYFKKFYLNNARLMIKRKGTLRFKKVLNARLAKL